MDAIDLNVVAPYVVAVVVVVALAFHTWYRQLTKSAVGIPSVRGGYWGNNDLLFGPKSHDWLVKECREIGKVFAFPRPFGKPLYIISDATAARKCLEDTKSEKTSFYYGVFTTIAEGSESFGNAVGHRWRHVRKRAAPFFAKAHRFHDKLVTMLNELTLEYMEKDPEKIPLRKFLCHFTSDVFIKVICNTNWRTMKDAQHIHESLLPIISSLTSSIDLFKLLFPDYYPELVTAKKLTAETRELMRDVLNRDREKQKNNPDYKPTDSLVGIISNNPDYKDDEERVTDLWDFMLAGFDATAVAMSWMLYDVARFPEHQTNLRNILLKMDKPEDRYRCQEVKWFVRESARMHVTHPLRSFRICGSAINVPHMNATIPKGSLCAIGFHAIMRDGDIFEKPDEFIPSRWEKPSALAMQAYMPFSAGPRNCIAMGLATEEMHVVMAEYLTKYQIDVAQHGEAIFCNTLGCGEAMLKFTPLAKK